MHELVVEIIRCIWLGGRKIFIWFGGRNVEFDGKNVNVHDLVAEILNVHDLVEKCWMYMIWWQKRKYAWFGGDNIDCTWVGGRNVEDKWFGGKNV